MHSQGYWPHTRTDGRLSARHPAKEAPLPYKTKPKTRNRLLGSQLEQARKRAGLSVEDVSEKTKITKPSLYRYEKGITAVRPDTVEKLARLYGVKDGEEKERWLEYARKAKAPGVWATSGSTMGPTYLDYADAESMADELRTWQPLVIPGLLQTREYSEEVIGAAAAAYPMATSYPVEELLKLREKRKEVLLRSEPPLSYWAVIGEAAVRTPCSGTGPWKAQLQHLLNLGDQGAVIQILPHGSGIHPGTSGAFEVLTFGSDSVVFREGYGDGAFIDDDDPVRVYRARYEVLQAQAMPIARSRKYIHEILSTI